MQNDKTSFEIDLLPFISVLAVIISFLLLTAVWVNVGSFNIKQALGDAAQESQKNPPSMWVTLDANGDVTLALKDIEDASSPKEIRISNVRSRVDMDSLGEMAISIKQQIPSLNTALIMPSQSTKYQDMIGVMDKLRKIEIRDLGVAPL